MRGDPGLGVARRAGAAELRGRRLEGRIGRAGDEAARRDAPHADVGKLRHGRACRQGEHVDRCPDVVDHGPNLLDVVRPGA